MTGVQTCALPISNGIIGTDIVAKAPANGYTLLFTLSAHVTNAAIRNDLPYDVLKDFAPVSLFTEFPLFLFASPSLSAQSVPELLALVRAKPGAFNYGSTGVGSAQHFAGEMFNAYAKTKVVHVSYKGIPAAMTDITSGAIAYSFFGPTLMPMVKAGKLKVLGATSAKRSNAFPDVPTIQEGGVPNYNFTQWHALLAPRNTPQPVIARLHEAVLQAVRDRDIVALLWVLRQMLERGGSLESFFLETDPGGDDVHGALDAFCTRAMALDLRGAYGRVPARPGVAAFFPKPSGGSACKRLNLFMRWMVRRDALDLGVWTRVSPSRLIIPLDTHIIRVAQCLRLTSYASPGWAMARDITRALRALDPDDPVRYDFSVCHLGMMNACGNGTPRGNAHCPLKGVCRPARVAAARE